jgi:hypothetical protein
MELPPNPEVRHRPFKVMQRIWPAPDVPVVDVFQEMRRLARDTRTGVFCILHGYHLLADSETTNDELWYQYHRAEAEQREREQEHAHALHLADLMIPGFEREGKPQKSSLKKPPEAV